MKRTTRSAPTIGRRAAPRTPPPSLSHTTSGASTSNRLCRSLVSTARRSDSDAARTSPGEAARRGRLPRVVVPVDLYGQPADLKAIREVCAVCDSSGE